MSYGAYQVGRITSVNFEIREEAERALITLRDAGGFKIRNREWGASYDSFNTPLDTDQEYRATVYCDRVWVWTFGRGKSYCYSILVVGKTIKDVERAKSYIDKLS